MSPKASVSPPDEREPETALVERARVGDRDAFGELYARHADEVHRFIGARVQERVAVDDIAADTWEAAWRSVARFASGNDRSFAPWVIGIARHRLLTHRNRSRPYRSLDDIERDAEHQVEPMAGRPLPEGQVVERDELRKVTAALTALPPRRRRALLLQIQGGLSEAGIAQEMGTSRTAVHSLLHRARQELRATVGTPVLTPVSQPTPRGQQAVRVPPTTRRRRPAVRVENPAVISALASLIASNRAERSEILPLTQGIIRDHAAR